MTGRETPRNDLATPSPVTDGEFVYFIYGSSDLAGLNYKGNLYVLADRKGGVLTCIDAKTGRQKWQGELGGSAPWWASVTAGDDKLYCISEAAQAVALGAGDEGFKVLCQVDMEDKPVQASIAIAEGRLFIRTANKLFCVGTRVLQNRR